MPMSLNPITQFKRGPQSSIRAEELRKFHTLVTRRLIDAATLSSCSSGAWSTSIRYEIDFPWLPNFSSSSFVGLPFDLRYSVL